MLVTPTKSSNLETRNQVMLERVKAQAHKDFEPIILDIDHLIFERVNKEADRIENKKKMDRLRVDLSAIVTDTIGKYLDQGLASSLEELATDQAQFEAKALNTVVSEPVENSILPEALVAAYLLWPMFVDGLRNPLLTPFLNDFKKLSADLVATEIRQGFAQNRATRDILSAIRGTKAKKFRDGKLAKIVRNHKTVSNAAIQFVASVSRHEAMKRSKIVNSYRWVSVLDSRTTAICRGLSGRVFEIGAGPLPPIHWGCRSSTAPVIDDRLLKRGLSVVGVVAGLTYYDWLKDQPEAFQDDVIGPTRGQLLRDGGLTATEFSRLSIDKNFDPLTLEEMRKKKPLIFEEAGL